ncbi:nucleotidyltransferase family protein [Thalassobius sp. Cn5-15]|uniref:nucleotidyltransferase family protein n=1 Tax=Thalassobius sp. Cn5-15 TaxID=2917763 RepID=UPI001EF2299B|nr:nucleotidyltransferase family protein [Thalassobius sp. Cn5-15]
MIHGAILILAAGASSRMGRDASGTPRDKLAEDVDGAPLLTRTAKAALATGWDVYACVPHLAHARVSLLPDEVTAIPVPDAAEGMGASLRSGMICIRQSTDNVLILPADMPDLSATNLRTIIAAHRRDQITRGASATGQAGHPVIFPARCFNALVRLHGDEGARRVVKGFDGRVELVKLPEDHALTDLDTPEAWVAWRAQR